MRHTISVLVENKFGVLTRVAGLFSGRGFNIERSTLLHTRPDHVRMTIVTRGERRDVDQIVKRPESWSRPLCRTFEGEFVDRGRS